MTAGRMETEMSGISDEREKPWKERKKTERVREKLNGISDEWAISHCLLASCCDCVSMVIISISDINPASTGLGALLTN